MSLQNSNGGGKHSGKSKMKKWQKVLLIILSVVIILTASAIALVKTGKNSLLKSGKMDMNPGNEVINAVTDDDGKTVIYQGKKYKYNNNITNILCVGVDKDTFNDKDTVQGKNGQADAVFLYSMDVKTGKATVLAIPRDTMVDVDLYSAGGKYISSEKKQICLAYAYGNNEKDSCKNTVKSASRLMYGLPINSYVAIDMKAIAPLASKVGGVPVTLTEDTVISGKRYSSGTKLELTGDAAISFVQDRDHTSVDSSLDRLSRQKQFLQGFFNKTLNLTKKDISTPIKLFNSISKNMVTDINVAEVSYLTTCLINGGRGGSLEFIKVAGEMKMGSRYAEYYADQQKLYETVLDTYYICE